jgi:hypothetical protein
MVVRRRASRRDGGGTAVASLVGKCLAGVAVGFSALTMTMAMLAAPASAALLAATCPSYGPCETITLTVNPDSVLAGATITITLQGTDGAANDTFTITLNSTPVTLGTITTNSAGTGSAQFTVPVGTAPGSHVITATDTDDPTVTASTGLTVLAPTAAVTPSAPLPFTGADVAGVTAAAAAAIGLGGLLLLGARRRHRKAWTSSGL